MGGVDRAERVKNLFHDIDELKEPFLVVGVSSFRLDKAFAALPMGHSKTESVAAILINESDVAISIEFHFPHLPAGDGLPLDDIGSGFLFPLANRECFVGVSRL